ncbi:hypothetical protein TWF679_008784 [Orbilia oligospora]|uniref:Uncharacterized protein n=1 Tax=Orbilia oligospora TaxID=2813651 RepID=A0A8H8V3Y5_ORBOL|nr:hypothetical protein TWF679_008784 [Orbilia oligospora]
MNITLILNAVKIETGTLPEHGTKLHEDTLHFAHEIIKGSQYSNDVARWHWAIIEKVKPYSNPLRGTPEARALERNSINLVEAVCIEYCLGKNGSSKKRTIDEVEEPEEKSKDGFTRKCRAEVPSVKEMAETGLSFKLDWNSMDENVTVFGGPQEDVAVAESKEHSPVLKNGGAQEDEKKDGDEDGGFDRKENQHPISSPHSLRKKLLKKLMLTAKAA